MEIDDQITTSKKTLGIRGKLFLGFAAITTILFISVFVCLIMIANTETFTANVVNRELPIYNHLVDLNSGVLLSQNSLDEWVLANDSKSKSLVASAWDKIQNSLTTLDSLIVDNGNTKNSLQSLRSALDELKTSQQKVLSTSDKAVASQLVVTDVLPKVSRVATMLNSIETGMNENAGILDTQSHQLSNDAKMILRDMHTLKLFEYGILLIGIILSIIITLITARNILPPLNNAIDIARKIASGRRNIKVVAVSNDETGVLLSSLKIMQNEIKEKENKLQLTEANTRELLDKIVKSAKLFSAHSSRIAAGDLREYLEVTGDDKDVMTQLGKDLNKMTENLASIAKEINQACQHMVTTVDEVHHAVDAQSAGASEQASSVNEITASLSEIEKSSAQTMTKAKALGESAERTREKGQQGLDAVGQSVSGMKSVRDKVQLIAQTILDLSNQTHQVGEITAVVNNLAQQSKMLALNASIEAAKAGEAGKGFAVVAVEVKNLAEQSEQATAQVQKILEDIQHAAEKAVMVTEEGTKGVDVGTQLVEQAGEIIRNLNDVIYETTIASQQIESAVRQESAGIEQITAGMNEINQVTTSFVISVKQTTEAISNLTEVAKGLKSNIDTYKI